MSVTELELLQRHKIQAAGMAAGAVMCGLAAIGLFLLPLAVQVTPGLWLFTAGCALVNILGAGLSTKAAIRAGLTVLTHPALHAAIRPAPPGWASATGTPGTWFSDPVSRYNQQRPAVSPEGEEDPGDPGISAHS